MDTTAQDRDILEHLRKKQSEKRRRRIGLGDIVAAVAQPVAKAIDAVAGTDLQNCSKCEQRKQALNKLGEKIAVS